MNEELWWRVWATETMLKKNSKQLEDKNKKRREKRKEKKRKEKKLE